MTQVRTNMMLLFPFRIFWGSERNPSCSGVAIHLLWTLILCSAWVVRAKASQADASDVKVNVGVAAAKPGDPIDIPVTLSGSEQAQVGGLVSHISFPKSLLSYTDVERGLTAELAEGEVKGSLQQDKDDSSLSDLELTVSAKNPIKPGILAYLKFRVSTDAPKGTIPLKMKDTKATQADGGPMQLAKGDDGEITIFALDEEIPVVGCFFFTH